jgi:hypothetical protein
MGVSPATGPTPNKGYEAAAKQGVALVTKKLMDLLPLAGTTDLGKTINKCIDLLMKHAVPGDTSQAAERNELDKMQQKNVQNTQTQQALQKPPMGGQPGGAQMPGMAA